SGAGSPKNRAHAANGAPPSRLKWLSERGTILALRMNNPETYTLPGLSLSSKSVRTREQPISYLIAEALRNPRLINLAAGLVDPLTLPVEECDAITRRLFSDPARGRAALQYDTTVGLAPLRQLLLSHVEQLEGLNGREMGLTENDFVVTTGSQQALYLIGDALLDPGDIVIAANPSYFVYTGTLDSLGAKVLTVPMDQDGMVVDEVEHLLARLERDGRLDRVKLVYCTSYFQNPTGLTLSAERRPRLLEIVRRFSQRHRILILEDAAYRELRYDGEAHRSIKSYDPLNRFTIISHTFSKPFAPGLKLGYTAMPPDLLHAVLQQKGNHDFGSANLTQHMALESLRDGSYHEHVKVLQDSYRLKRDAMLAALTRHMPDDGTVTWTHPHGGLYVWLALPAGSDTSRTSPMFQNAVDRGVLYVPGAYCFQPDDRGVIPTNHIRLSFGQVAPDQIEPGISRLASVIRESLAAQAANPKSEIRNPQSDAVGAVG
ncbi:MAG: PLP-dependent aminotransferase family protein, partial [Gemmatimonadota bacterium]|nr:PLP-dependent aminotransferase family protein [Gemmatimonadota bacterium]